MKEKIIANIQNFVKTSKDNQFDFIDGCGYEEPVIGFASIYDSLFLDYKTIIGPEHLTPAEAFEKVYGTESIAEGTVISIAFPVNKKIVTLNRQMKEWPSKEWTLLRTLGDELFIPKVAAYLSDFLKECGYCAVSPRFYPWCKVFNKNNSLYSNWSERHVAYAAGLGTFSLNDAMITERGICVKFVSIVTDLKLLPDERKFKNHTENCLYLRNGTCGACIERCPAGAITKNGHDHIKCYSYVYGEESKNIAEALGVNRKAGSGCALCQSKVPCEFGIPKSIE